MKHLPYLAVLLLAVAASLLAGCCHTNTAPNNQTTDGGKNVPPAVGNPGPRY